MGISLLTLVVIADLLLAAWFVKLYITKMPRSSAGKLIYGWFECWVATHAVFSAVALYWLFGMGGMK